jgi:outer membrane murein-binding lipoprotein Lpp
MQLVPVLMSMQRSVLFAAVGSVLLLTGCSQFQQGFKEGMNQSDYTDAMKTNFMAQCSAEAVKNVSAEVARKYCECAFDRISSTIPVDEWTKLDAGETVREETSTALKVAVTQCGGSAANL